MRLKKKIGQKLLFPLYKNPLLNSHPSGKDPPKNANEALQITGLTPNKKNFHTDLSYLPQVPRRMTRHKVLIAFPQQRRLISIKEKSGGQHWQRRVSGYGRFGL